MRIVILLAAALVFATTCAAQTPSPTPKHVVTIGAPPTITSIDRIGQARIIHIGESDATEVRLELKPYRTAEESVRMSFDCWRKGKNVVAPEAIYLTIVFSTDKAKPKSVSSFSFEADGELVNLNDMAKEDDVNKEGSKWYIHVRGKVPFVMFEKLVNAKSLKVHVADVVFEMDKKSRDGLRDLLTALEKPKAVPND